MHKKIRDAMNTSEKSFFTFLDVFFFPIPPILHASPSYGKRYSLSKHDGTVCRSKTATVVASCQPDTAENSFLLCNVKDYSIFSTQMGTTGQQQALMQLLHIREPKMPSSKLWASRDETTIISPWASNHPRDTLRASKKTRQSMRS